MTRVLIAGVSLALAVAASAGVKTQIVTYTLGDTTFEGFLAWD